MSYHVKANAQAAKNQGLKITLAVHVVVIVLMLIPYVVSTSQDTALEPDTEMVVFDFSKPDLKIPESFEDGGKPDKLSGEESEGEPEPAAKPEQPSEEPIEKPKVAETPKPNPAPAPKPVIERPVVTTPNESPVTASRPSADGGTPSKGDEKVDSRGLFPKDWKNKSDKHGDGKQNTAGNNGNSNQSGSDGEGSNGVGISSGFSKRSVIYRPKLVESSNYQGTIVLQICIDKFGQVVAVTPKAKGSTSQEAALVKNAVEYAWKYRYSADADAPEKQCGLISIIFKVK